MKRMEFKEFIKPSIEGGFVKLFFLFTSLMLFAGFSFYTGAIVEGVAFVTFLNVLLAFTISRELKGNNKQSK